MMCDNRHPKGLHPLYPHPLRPETTPLEDSESEYETLAAYWNSNPDVRFRLTEIPDKIASVEGISLPEKRVNTIAAEIYTQLDTITGKYTAHDSFTA